MDTQYYNYYKSNGGHYSDPYQPIYSNSTSEYALNESVLTLLFGGGTVLLIFNCLYNIGKRMQARRNQNRGRISIYDIDGNNISQRFNHAPLPPPPPLIPFIQQQISEYILSNDVEREDSGVPPIITILKDSIIRDEGTKKKIEEMNQSCTICLENMNSINDLTMLPCQHIYHSQCINNWILNTDYNDECPLCKVQLI